MILIFVLYVKLEFLHKPVWIPLGTFVKRTLFLPSSCKITDQSTSYDKAREIKGQQDAFCEKVLNGEWDGQSKFPEELQWEATVDVLRGKVKV